MNRHLQACPNFQHLLLFSLNNCTKAKYLEKKKLQVTYQNVEKRIVYFCEFTISAYAQLEVLMFVSNTLPTHRFHANRKIL